MGKEKGRLKILSSKSSFLIAASTACFLSRLTLAVPLRMRDTVLGDTPAACATISRVTTPAAFAFEVVEGDRLRRVESAFIVA